MNTYKPCKWCQSSYHFSFQCRKKPNTPNSGVLKQRKPIKKVGKVTKKWLSVRKAYLDKQGSYGCFYCGKPLERNEVEVDHYRPRGSHPELRFKETNLRISCHNCNRSKGSIDGDIFIKRYKEG